MIHNRPTATQTGPTTMLPMRSPSTPRYPLEQMSIVSIPSTYYAVLVSDPNSL